MTAISSFNKCVLAQISLLLDGHPMEAFDRYFSTSGRMYANGVIFADSAIEGRRKQEPFINSAVTIQGKITDLNMLEPMQICVFRNQSSFITADGIRHQINGLCWQKWCNGKITEEHYFDGENMQTLLSKGILINPNQSLNTAI